MRITTDINRVYIRDLIKNHVYHNKTWILYQSYDIFFKHPPEIWRYNLGVKLIIAWNNDNKPIGVLHTSPWTEISEGKKSTYIFGQIYIKPKYRNQGIGTKLIEKFIELNKEQRVLYDDQEKLVFHYAGFDSILRLEEKFKDIIKVRGKSVKEAIND